MIKPLLNYVLIQPEEPAEKTEGGIYLPQGMRKDDEEYGRSATWEIGTILAVGPGKVTDDNIEINPRLQAGRRCMFKAYNGQIIEAGPDKDKVLIPSEQVAGYVD